MAINNRRDAGRRLVRRLTIGSSLAALGATGVFAAVGAATIPGTTTASAATTTASAATATASSATGSSAAQPEVSAPVATTTTTPTTTHAVTGASR
jgi:hypothetical protein